MSASSPSQTKGMGVLGRSYLATGSRTSLSQAVERKGVSSESSFCSDTSVESESEEEMEESEVERGRCRRKKWRREWRQSVSDCWRKVWERMEFAENAGEETVLNKSFCL